VNKKVYKKDMIPLDSRRGYKTIIISEKGMHDITVRGEDSLFLILILDFILLDALQ
jgi:hypothetical protein